MSWCRSVQDSGVISGTLHISWPSAAYWGDGFQARVACGMPNPHWPNGICPKASRLYWSRDMVPANGAGARGGALMAAVTVWAGPSLPASS